MENTNTQETARSGKPGRKRQPLRETIKKWTRPVLKPGFTIFPSVLLEKQDELKLDPVEVNLLLQLIRCWWKADRMPFPAKRTLARLLGIDDSTVRRRMASLEERGFIQRLERVDDGQGRRSNYYDLRPLVDVLHPFAVKSLKEREQKKVAREARRRRAYRA